MENLKLRLVHRHRAWAETLSIQCAQFAHDVHSAHTVCTVCTDFKVCTCFHIRCYLCTLVKLLKNANFICAQLRQIFATETTSIQKRFFSMIFISKPWRNGPFWHGYEESQKIRISFVAASWYIQCAQCAHNMHSVHRVCTLCTLCAHPALVSVNCYQSAHYAICAHLIQMVVPETTSIKKKNQSFS